MSQSPFAISFGRKNEKIIERDQESSSIFEDFNAEQTRKLSIFLLVQEGAAKQLR